MIPARYGRLWSVAAAAILFWIILAVLRHAYFSDITSPNGRTEGEQKIVGLNKPPLRPPLLGEDEALSSSSSLSITTPRSIPTTAPKLSPPDDAAPASQAEKEHLDWAANVDSEELDTDDPSAELQKEEVQSSGVVEESKSAGAPPDEAASKKEETLSNEASQQSEGEKIALENPQAVTGDDGKPINIQPMDPAAPTTSTAVVAPAKETSKIVVVGRLKDEDTDWIGQELQDWQNAIYYVDLPNNETSPSGLRTPINKAREAMPYLTYIIDNYPTFPDIVAFIHPHMNIMPQSWHTDARGHSAVFMLQDLKLDAVLDRGYVNLRCNNEVGCPEEIKPFRDPPDPEKHAEHIYADVYGHFFGVNETQMREQIPVVATQCCAQFAVSSAQLAKRPKEDYEMYRKFLEETEYDDESVGRVMEYMWHIIFGKEAVHCENVFECWCNVYGRCHQFALGHAMRRWLNWVA